MKAPDSPLQERLLAVQRELSGAQESAGRELTLVAVSKTKPVEMIIEAYMAGHRDFGENYIQELVDKSHDKQIVENCPDIRYDVPVSFVKLNFSCQMAFHRELSDQQSEQIDDKFQLDSR